MHSSDNLSPDNKTDTRKQGPLRFQLRRLLTGFSFVVFGLGSLDIAFLIFPLLLVFVHNPAKRRRCIQTVIRWHFRAFIKLMQVLGIMTLDTKNLERLKTDQGTLIIANHPTLIDVVVLMAFLPEVDCVVKEGLNKNIFLRGVVRVAGYITNSDHDALLEGCTNSLGCGHNLIIFPEGTRSVEGEPYRFQRGVAHVVLRAGCPIRPVYLSCTPATLSKQHKWYDIPDRPLAYRVSVGNLIDVSPWQHTDKISISTRQFTRHLEQHYQQHFADDAAF